MSSSLINRSLHYSKFRGLTIIYHIRNPSREVDLHSLRSSPRTAPRSCSTQNKAVIEHLFVEQSLLRHIISRFVISTAILSTQGRASVNHIWPPPCDGIYPGSLWGSRWALCRLGSTPGSRRLRARCSPILRPQVKRWELTWFWVFRSLCDSILFSTYFIRSQIHSEVNFKIYACMNVGFEALWKWTVFG